jgi:hypothetical protein
MVVARITQKTGLDLNHDGKPDEYCTDLFYRDACYDAFEKEFRGFSFAQRIQRGDDYDPATNYTDPLGFLRLSGPSTITRFRYHTGSADGVDNGAYPAGYAGPTPMDEFFPRAGTEEEALKGLVLMEENIDAATLADPAASFHRPRPSSPARRGFVFRRETIPSKRMNTTKKTPARAANTPTRP